ncbi:MAG TPA: gamma-glutamyl-gamma-aminobutyrate hydrolase family protein [Pyrinomonadaceae bacterium]|nr:gamma-glutamyl-gamma-aminobutyrate hydrolase family protein [Pyrinomonadaceae bacterium]
MKERMSDIAILGEYDSAFTPHVATGIAIGHSSAALGTAIKGEWVSTQDIDESLFSRYSGLWVAPGSPYKNLEKTLWAIEHARKNNVPCFGTCGGFQHMVLEYARNVLHYQDAQHAEYDPYASTLFISRLDCSLKGREMELRFESGSLVARIYESTSAREEYYCNFGVDPGKVGFLGSSRLRISGSDSEGEVRVIELPGHPFYVGTLFVPQTRSTEQQPHPLVTAFVQAVAAARPN